MIDIVERPSETGKLIHLNPRDWKSYQDIDKALYEEQAPEDYGEYDTPDKYPTGTVAELRMTGRAIHFYIMKQDDGRWRRLTEPFDFFAEGLPMAALSATHFTLTILYKPSSERTTTTMIVLQANNTDIGKQMSHYPEQFLNSRSGDLCTRTYIQVDGYHNPKQYNGTLHDLPVGTVIHFQIPCFPVVNFLVKQPNGIWNEVTVANLTWRENILMSYQYATATIIYMPQ